MLRWWTRAKGVIATALPSVVEPPSSADEYVWFGNQRGPSKREWERKLAAHAARQERERREEAEQARLMSEAVRQEVARHNGALFPPSTAETHGLGGLGAFIRDMIRDAAWRS